MSLHMPFHPYKLHTLCLLVLGTGLLYPGTHGGFNPSTHGLYLHLPIFPSARKEQDENVGLRTQAC